MRTETNERHYTTYCRKCGRTLTQETRLLRCPCGGSLDFRYKRSVTPKGDPGAPGIWRYAGTLPVDTRFAVTLEEGNTPLLRTRVLPSVELYIKDETRNPTGSMKDRALAVAISKVREWGAPHAVLFSMGSTGLAAAAYAARAGINLTVLVLETVAPEVLFPLQQMGARVVAVRGDADIVMDTLQETCRRYGFVELTTCRSSNPYQSEGPKTIAYEVVRQGLVPDWIAAPIGGGGTLAGIWKGLRELHDAGYIDRLPRMLGVQVRGYHALRLALDKGLSTEEEIKALVDGFAPKPTVATKLAHRFPFDAMEVLEAIRRSGGNVAVVDDQACLEWAARLASTEGIFVEPSSATVLAGVDQMLREGVIEQGSRVVALATGSGFREIPYWSGFVKGPELPVIDARPDALARAIEGR